MAVTNYKLRPEHLNSREASFSKEMLIWWYPWHDSRSGCRFSLARKCHCRVPQQQKLHLAALTRSGSCRKHCAIRLKLQNGKPCSQAAQWQPEFGHHFVIHQVTAASRIVPCSHTIKQSIPVVWKKRRVFGLLGGNRPYGDPVRVGKGLWGQGAGNGAWGLEVVVVKEALGGPGQASLGLCSASKDLPHAWGTSCST